MRQRHSKKNAKKFPDVTGKKKGATFSKYYGKILMCVFTMVILGLIYLLSHTHCPKCGELIQEAISRPKFWSDIQVNRLEDNFHTVVSSGCSAYQNWQVEVLMHSWWKIKQPGKFTRIVSGCKDDVQKKRAMKTAIPTDRVRYFFTPDYAPPPDFHGQKFFFFNKPYGVRQFFESTYIEEDVVMLIDPDMIIYKQFRNHMPDDPFYVTEGNPAAAKYGIGDKWLPWKLCNVSDCNIDVAGAWKYYSVGPPYIMHKNDWIKIVERWAFWSPPALKHDPPPSVLAEMYSYVIACAEIGLRFQVTKDYMLSVAGDDEPWNLVDWKLQEFGPHICHYCHSYWIGSNNAESSPKKGGFNFHKGHVPRHILEDCDIPLFHPAPVDDEAKKKDHEKGNENVYMLHWVIKGANEAFFNYKKMFCPNWKPSYNLYLQQPAPWNKNKMWYIEGSDKEGNNPGAAQQHND